MTDPETDKELARLRAMESDLESGDLAWLPNPERRDLLYQVRLQISDIELTTTLNKARGRKRGPDAQEKDAQEK